jgi:hypothetical protein
MKNAASPFVLLLLLLISSQAYSQIEGDKIRFHVVPYNFFDPVTGVLQVGVQKDLNQRFAISLDHGFKMQTFRNLITDGESERKNYKYSKTKAELKYFVRDHRSANSSYISMEGMYFPQKYLKEKDYLIIDNIHYRYEYSHIDRTVWTASLKYGTEIRVKNFVFDHFIGLGVRRLSIAHQPSDLIETQYHQEADISFPPIDRNEGVFYRPHVSMGLKVGYILK